MKIIFDIDQKQLNKFVAENGSEFLQSFEWGEFQQSVGYKIFRLGVEENGELVAVATLIKKNLGLGKSYFYCPKGPVINFQFSISNFQTIFNFLILEIQKIAKLENAIFLRLENLLEIGNWKLEIKRTIDVQPSKTLILDLSKTEEQLLAEMHQKTRYNIRLAEKKGVVIREARAEEFEVFWKLMSETVERDGFRLHEKEYYKKMIDEVKSQKSDRPVFDPEAQTRRELTAKAKVKNESQPSSRAQVEGNSKVSSLDIKLFFSEYNNKILSAGLFAFFGDTVTYMHGASSNQDRNIMAPYLLQWHAIKSAKQEGFKFYDFYGIDEIKWPGVTRFKKGFGGNEKLSPGTFDAIFSSAWYNIYCLLRKIRRSV